MREGKRRGGNVQELTDADVSLGELQECPDSGRMCPAAGLEGAGRDGDRDHDEQNHEPTFACGVAVVPC